MTFSSTNSFLESVGYKRYFGLSYFEICFNFSFKCSFEETDNIKISVLNSKSLIRC